ncbi:MAG: DNA repair protein RecO [Bacteroidales bacterium]|nr:DNA repair protein RecO [Bacteroidales bacterium]
MGTTTLNTQGLVLHTTNYSETSVVAKIFTRQLGERSYLVKGVRGGRSKAKRNLLQPMSYLEMTVYDNRRAQLQYIKEMQPARPMNGCATNSVKTALLFFMNEVLYKTVREEEPNPCLFDFLVGQMETLDQTDEPLGDFPVMFLLRLALYLGIEPLDNYSRMEPLFQMREGRFLAPPQVVHADPGNLDYYLAYDDSLCLHSYLDSLRNGIPRPLLPSAIRRQMTSIMLQYYAIHLPGFKEIRSIEVLHQILA